MNAKIKYRNFFSYFLTVLFIWLVYFFIYIFNLSDQVLFYFSFFIYIFFFFTLTLLIKKKIFLDKIVINYFLILFFLIIIFYLSINFRDSYIFAKEYLFEKTFWYWDAIQVWNKAAINLFFNEVKEYQIYPVLYPSQWSLIYKIQGNKDIWFLSKLSLFFLPLIFLVQIYSSLFNKKYNSKEKLYVFIFFIVSFLYFINPSQFQHIFSGYMDSLLAFYFICALFFCKIFDITKENSNLYLALLIASLATLIKQTGFFLLLIIYINIYFLNKNFFLKSLWFLLIPFSYYYFFWFLKFNLIETYLNKLNVFDEHSNIERKTFFEFIINSFKDLNLFFLLTIFIGMFLRIYQFFQILKNKTNLNLNFILSNRDLVVFIVSIFLIILNYKIFSYDNRNFFIIHSMLIYLSMNSYYVILEKIDFNLSSYNFNKEIKFLHPTLLSLTMGIIFLLIVTIYSISSTNYKFSNFKLKLLHEEQLLKLGDKDLNLFILENYNNSFNHILTNYDYLIHIPKLNIEVNLCKGTGCDQFINKALNVRTLFIFRSNSLPKSFENLDLKKINVFKKYIFYSN